MLHHLSLPATNLDRSKHFYDAVLETLGYRCVFKSPTYVGYGLEEHKDKFALKPVETCHPPGPGFHVAISAPTRAAVDAFHRVALEQGAQDEGAPGLRPHYGPTYYAAFVNDLDGHRIEAVCKAPS